MNDFMGILMYHRVIDLEADGYSLAVSPVNFSEQLDLLQKFYNIIPLQDLVNSIKKEALSPKTISITFDDGYGDNYYNVIPLLVKKKIPATFFITGQSILNNEEYWWDQLEYLLLNDKINYSEWENIGKVMSALPLEEREMLISNLFDLAKLRRPSRTAYRKMNIKELKEISSSDLFEIGAHTMHHCSLGHETSIVQSREILDSKLLLEKELLIKINGFAYPRGNAEDINGFTLDYIKSVGFTYAVTAIDGIVSRNSDDYYLPRIYAGNWPGSVLINKLDQCLGRI